MSSPNKSRRRENTAKYHAQRILYESGAVNDETMRRTLQRNKRKIRKDIRTGEIFKKGGTLNNLSLFERLNKNRKISNGFGVCEILATVKKVFQ